MKKSLFLSSFFLSVICFSCATKIPSEKPQDRQTVQAKETDTLRIANDDIGYEVIIIDSGFNSWLIGHARPRGFYSQQYLEARNVSWVNEWNLRVNNPLRYGDLYGMRIDYGPGTDYGYEVNYLLFNYFVYFQQQNGVNLGSFAART